MALTRRKYFIIPLLVIILMVSGCMNKKTPIEKMYDVLEKVVSKEKVFEEQQNPLISLEKQEKEIYDQIIGLGMKEYDQIVKLSDEALTLTDKRKAHMEKETTSLKESEKEFTRAADIKDELDDPALKQLANDLYDTMMQRYQAHDVLYTEYSEALTFDKELYEMFKNKNLPLEDLEEQVKKLNDSYKKISDANENFNHLTEAYNNKKLEFYQKAGLKTEK